MITTEATFTLDVAGTSSQPLVLTTGSNIISLLEGSGRGTLVASFSVPDNKILDAVSIVGSPLAAPFYISGNGLYYRGDPRSYMNDDPFATVTLEFDVSDEDTGRLEPLYEHTISVRTIPALEVEITDNTGTIVGEGGHIDIAEAGDTVIENPNQPRTSLIVAGTTEAVRLGTITVKNSSSFTNIVVDFADTNHEYFENGVHKYIEIRSTATGADFFLKAGQQLDYETLEDLQKLMFGINAKVTAQTSTGYTLSHVTPVNFEVTNANDYTTAKTEYALNVDEDAEVGSLLGGTIELSDVDSIKPSRIRMEFVGEGEDVSTHSSLFGFQQQDSSNPLVWNLVLLSRTDLDYGARATYNTTILAKILRNGYEGREQKLYFNVDINVMYVDFDIVPLPPNSDVQTPFIHASAAIGDSAGSISATFGNRVVTYDLTADHYAINSTTGEITLKSPFDGTDLIPTESDGRIFHTINVEMFANRGTNTKTTTEPFKIEVNATTASSTPITLEKDGSDYKADNSDLSADRDGDTLSFKETTAITTRDGNTVTGSYTVSGSGELEWTPDATFSGIATFDVTIKDNRGGEGKVSVTVNVPPPLVGTVISPGNFVIWEDNIEVEAKGHLISEATRDTHTLTFKTVDENDNKTPVVFGEEIKLEYGKFKVEQNGYWEYALYDEDDIDYGSIDYNNADDVAELNKITSGKRAVEALNGYGGIYLFENIRFTTNDGVNGAEITRSFHVYVKGRTDIYLHGDPNIDYSSRNDHLSIKAYYLNNYKNNNITSGSGNDFLHGGVGKDTLKGLRGDDILYGGAGNDTLNGDNGLSDWQNHGNDVLYGGPGLDYLGGDGGNDTLYGGADNDILGGLWGDDILYGENGNDGLTDIYGRNVLTGGSGNDYFRIPFWSGGEFWTEEGLFNIVTDFGVGNDKIGLDRGYSKTDLQSMKDVANIRWTSEFLDTSTSTNDSSISDTVFYYTRGTDTYGDDLQVMVLEDYTQDLTIDQFVNFFG